jgi:hypothetical protein
VRECRLGVWARGSGKTVANARRDVREVIHKFDEVGHGVTYLPCRLGVWA